MDIVLLDQKALKVKGKSSSIVIDANTSTGKTEADAVVTLEESTDLSDKKIEGFRITIKGPGEYEVNGTKISGMDAQKRLVVSIDVDGVKVVIGQGSAIEKIHDKIEASDVLVIRSDSEFNSSFVASLEPRVVLVYGERKNEVAKSLGKDSAEKTSKFSTTYEKLPSELQVLVLG